MKVSKLLGLIALVACTAHPVSQNIVDAIRQKTLLWTPVEVGDNQFSNHTAEEISGLLGWRITQTQSRENNTENTT